MNDIEKDRESGFIIFLKNTFETFLPFAGRHFVLPVLVVLIAHLILTLKSWDYITEEYLLLISFFNVFLCTTFIIARPPNFLETNFILKKRPNIYECFYLVDKNDFPIYSDKSRICIDEFLKWWTRTCLIWLLYYTVSFFFVLFFVQKGQLWWLDIVFDVFNYCSTYTLFLCYFVLAFPSIIFDKKKYYKIRLIAGVCFGVFLFFDCWSKISFMADRLTEPGLQIESKYWFFSVIAGFVSASFFSLLVARLDSKIMQVPAIVIFALFIYASIQSFFPLLDFIAKYDTNKGIHFFNESKILRYRNLLLHGAFLGKLLLFLLIFWGCRHYRLYNYFVRLLDVEKKYPRSRAIIYKELEELYGEKD